MYLANSEENWVSCEASLGLDISTETAGEVALHLRSFSLNLYTVSNVIRHKEHSLFEVVSCARPSVLISLLRSVVWLALCQLIC